MASLSLRSAAAAAALLLLWGAPAQAQSIPEGPVRIFLKDHPDIPLAADGAAAELSTEPDLWRITPNEAYVPVGSYQIVHEESGQCLTADTSGGGATAPVFLADCAGAVVWESVYDDRPAHYDFRFSTTGNYYLGLQDNEDAVDGARILAVKRDEGPTLHAQEWQFTGGDTPPSQPPASETPSNPDQSSAPPEVSDAPDAPGVPDAAAGGPALPMLPQTGVGMGLAAGAGAVALLGGAALVLWWQRRRFLRSHW